MGRPATRTSVLAAAVALTCVLATGCRQAQAPDSALQEATVVSTAAALPPSPVSTVAAVTAAFATTAATEPPTTLPPTVMSPPTVSPPTVSPPTVSPTTVLPTTVLPTVTALPTATATTEPSPSATPHPMDPATIDGLAARAYPGGTIEILRTLETTADYTRSYIAYPSDGLRITGVMQVPPGEGPFPVIVLNHGYYDRGAYWSGSGTWMLAEYLNRRGYLTIAPDYRGWGESDWAPSLFHTGLVADVINLVSALPSVPQADPNRVGMWGHSMGGGITTKVAVVDPRIRAAVLHAPNSPDDADLIARWGRGCLPGESTFSFTCNPGEIVPPDLPPDLVQAYVAAAADPDMLRRIAPIGYLDRVSAPFQLHIGTADGIELAATPPEWTTKLAEALRAAGKPVDLYVYEGQSHLFGGQAWADMAARTADFFDAWVK